MQKSEVQLPEIKLVGLTIRTSYQNEIDPNTGKIGTCVERYLGEGFYEKIPNRTKPGVTYCVYTDYDSDYKGEYTYFIGEEVGSFENVPESLETHIIPEQKYIKFTNGPDAMPNVVIEAWKQIWEMEDNKSLGGKRRYHSDFEIYDERAQDPQNIVLDVFIGVDV